uniref:Ribosomal protein S10 n=1 Tax=Ancoracysta twista TaxID=2044563 RepID=A0A2H4R8E6_9EUKA|nr:ribosomal protein S10 [Ancoracysta twista]ATY40922.1 ribosomal protein S10 [Ancoracysta twista]
MNKTLFSISLSSHNGERLEHFSKQLILLLGLMGIAHRKSSQLPTQKDKITLLSSPHVYKKAREQFELLTHQRVIHCFTTTKGGVTVPIRIIKMFIKELQFKTPAGIAVRLNGNYNLFEQLKKAVKS